MEKERYHHISPLKFVALSVLTFGLYELYWCYKCWKYIRTEEDSRISPFWRAFFAPLWIYPLSKRIYAGEKKLLGVLLAVAYFLMSALWKLSDPYWLLSSLTFVSLLPLVFVVDSLNRADGFVGLYYRKIGLKLALFCCLCTPIAIFSFLSSFSIVPSTQVIEGERLYSFHESFFESIGALHEDEKVLYFYSAGFLSYKEDGNFFTDRRVVSYWRDPGPGEIHVDQAEYSDIQSIDPEFTDSYLEDSIVTITLKDDTQFSLYISNELGKDHVFYESLKHRWRLNKTGYDNSVTAPPSLRAYP
jgi:hypothetical protein